MTKSKQREEESERLFKAMPCGIDSGNNGEGMPDGFQLVPDEQVDKRQQRSFGEGRRCWWVGCCTVLSRYDDGKLGRQVKKMIGTVYPKERVVLCFMHQRHLNMGAFALEHEERIRFMREHLCKPNDSLNRPDAA